MAKIKNIKGRQVFDSRGNPTVEAEVFSENGNSTTAIVPSGASTGTHEAFELRDKENKKYLGKSVFIAIENINKIISPNLKGINIYDQEKIDKTLLSLDGTKEKKNESWGLVTNEAPFWCLLRFFCVLPKTLCRPHTRATDKKGRREFWIEKVPLT